MVLAVDIGNSNTRCALFEREAIAAHFSLPTDTGKDAAFYEQKLTEGFADARRAVQDVRHVIVGSVVPEARGLCGAMGALFEGRVTWADPQMDFGFAVQYDDPSQMGIDRLAGGLGASQLYGVPVIVADVGTAITVDMVTADGRFVAGVIAPGMRLGAEALHQGTGLLPGVEPGGQAPLVGRSTADCIRSGVFFSAVGLVDRVIAGLRSQVDPAAFAVATGGDADCIAQACTCVQTVNPHLVLWGLYRLHQRLGADDSGLKPRAGGFRRATPSAGP